MKVRSGLLLSIGLLIVLMLTLAACEKDRPAPATTRTPAAGTTTTAAGTTTPQAEVTTVALPALINGGQAVTGTPGAGSTTAAPQANTNQSTTGGATTQQPAAPGQSFTYTVVKGDTVAKIARRFNVTQESIVSLNGLANPDVLQLGQKLKIPGAAPAGGTSSDTYTVQAGDTLFTIAQRFGVSTQELQKLNNITDANQVSVGQVLRIPTPGATTAADNSGSTASGKTYVVKRGDTLASIATRLGVTMAALRKANNITNPDQIQVGQVLKVP